MTVNDAPVVAVDGGNTKTEAAVVAPDGRLLGMARGGVGDIYGHLGEQGAVDEVVRVVNAALADAGAHAIGVRHAAFRLAGLDWSDDIELWRHALQVAWPGLSASLKNDGFVFTHAGAADGHAISVVLGTGGAIAGAGPGGEFAVSWWLQHGLGAAGIVGTSIRAAALAELGLGPATRLQHLLPSLLGVHDVEGVLHATTRRHTDWHHTRLAGLAPSLMVLWREDDVFTTIVEAQGAIVADYVNVVARRCSLPEDVPVVVGGGMMKGAPHIADVVRGALLSQLPDCRVHLDPGSALFGTALSALAEAEVSIDHCAAGALREAIDHSLL